MRVHIHTVPHTIYKGGWEEDEQERGLGLTPPGESPNRKETGIFTEPQSLSLHRYLTPQCAPPAGLALPHLFTVKSSAPRPEPGRQRTLPGGCRIPLGRRRGREGGELLHSLLLLPGGDSDQLLGCLGDVVGTLDDLLGQELVVHWGSGLRGHSLAALTLQAVGTGIEQPQGAAHCLQGWLLQGERRDHAKKEEKTSPGTRPLDKDVKR